MPSGNPFLFNPMGTEVEGHPRRLHIAENLIPNRPFIKPLYLKGSVGKFGYKSIPFGPNVFCKICKTHYFYEEK